MSLPKILDVSEGKVVINESILSIPEFLQVWEKYKDIQIFQYIYSMYDPESPYGNIDELDKEEFILKDYPIHGYLNEIDVIRCIEKAEKLYDSPIRKILKGTKNAVEKLVSYFDTMTIESGRDGNIAAVKSAIVDMPKIITAYQNAEQAYKQEVQRSRGDIQSAVDEDYESNYDD